MFLRLQCHGCSHPPPRAHVPSFLPSRASKFYIAAAVVVVVLFCFSISFPFAQPWRPPPLLPGGGCTELNLTLQEMAQIAVVQGDYDGRGQQSCKSNFDHFYIEAQPPCSHSLCEAPTPLLTQLTNSPSSGCGWPVLGS